MDVAVASPDSNFCKLAVIPPIIWVPGLLPLIITEVPFNFDFGEIHPLPREATPTAIIRDDESTPLPYSAFLVAVVRNSHT